MSQVKGDAMFTTREPPALPPGTKPLANQVAGHKYGEGRSKLGCLQHIDGTLLKPVQYPPKGQREVDFYLKVFGATDDTEGVLEELQCYVPQFFGIYECDKKSKVKYLKLENLLGKLSYPCVLDIKMGKVTYDPEAPPEKIALELAKFPPAMNLGYQFSGMQVYSPEQKKIVKYDKYYCKKLTEDTMIKQGLGKFFMIDFCLKKELIKTVIKKLKAMRDWFLKQRTFAFYASSILIVYEGAESEHREETDCSTHNGIADKVTCIDDDERTINGTAKLDETFHYTPQMEVKMIDFTHVFPSSEEDQNYLFGLQNLIQHLELLLEDGS